MLALALSIAATSALTPVSDFGDNPAGLAMFEHVPASSSSSSAPMPLVLALHGCGEDHTYADDVGLTALADTYGFALAVAETNSSENTQLCFNWFFTFDTDRDSGEAASLASMVASMKERHPIDDGRVFVTGLSAGGAMAVALLAQYPDVFAAGAVFAGIPFRCATDVIGAYDCVQSGSGLTKTELTHLVTDNTTFTSFPRIAIWAGTADQTVSPVNSDDLVKQWTGVHGLTLTPTSTTTNGAAQVSRFEHAGDVVIESVRVPGMDHGVPIDPAHGCGVANNGGGLDVGLCGSLEALRFFGIATDVTPPFDAGVVGEGEGEGEGAQIGEGEGAQSGEGEGEGAHVGEGEGEGSAGDVDAGADTQPSPTHTHTNDAAASAPSCASTSSSTWLVAIAIVCVRRRGKSPATRGPAPRGI